MTKNRILAQFIIIVSFIVSLFASAAEAAPKLDLTLSFKPSAGSLHGIARIHLEEPVSEFTFTLHRNLVILANAAYKIQVKNETGLGRVYSFGFKAPVQNFSIDYQGMIDEAVTDDGQSPGVIKETGISLLSDSYFYPVSPVSYEYDVKVELPAESWKAILPGELVHEDKSFVRYKSFSSESDLALIANQFYPYQTLTPGGVMVQVWLRSEDPALAEQYLSLIPTYISRFEGLIGQFPFKNFTVVENFLETGYAFSGFTLLGPSVIRLPFILRSSLPHEILHSWWGNSVAVDSIKGNWCEGLTTYMADLAFKVEDGRGSEYRRTTLQSYQDFISTSNDFPVRKFIARNDRGTQAVGYGKSMMIFQMLENFVGTTHFSKALSNFYARNVKQSVGFSDLQKAFEDEMKFSMDSFFTPWLDQTGVPDLSISNIVLNKKNLSFQLSQTQAARDSKYVLPVRIRTIFDDGSQADSFVNLISGSQQVAMTLPRAVKRLLVDPNFEVFRTLYPEETPASFSNVLSDENTVRVSIPAGETVQFQEWLAGAQALYSKKILVITDAEPYPKDGVLWILGSKNKHAISMQAALKLHHVTNLGNTLSLNNQTWTSDRSAVFITESVNSVPSVWAWTEATQPGAVLMKKIGHYTSFSIAGFTDLKNDLKETWQTERSPLIVEFVP